MARTANSHADVPIGLLHEGRKQGLDDWGFTCKCALCSSSADKLNESDRNKDRLREILLALQDGSPDSSSTISELAAEADALIDRESMWPALCQVYQAVAGAYMDTMDFENADRYVGMAEDMCVQIAGEEQGGLQRAPKHSRRSAEE